ncbi:9654_t:CDS:2, partial [Paraglomus brasilianum]
RSQLASGLLLKMRTYKVGACTFQKILTAPLHTASHSDLLNKLAVITGGSRGIGYAIAQKFSQNGAQCIVISKNSDKIAQAASKLNSEATVQKKHVGIACDLRNREEIENSINEDINNLPINKRIDELGKVNILVNAAGITRDCLSVKINEKDVGDVINTNLLGTIYMCSYLSKSMIRQRQGCIINISSVAGLYGNVGQSIYAASKAGIIGFSKSLAKELAPKNIRVNVIAPGYIETDMTSGILDERSIQILSQTLLGRFGKPKDIASAALYLSLADYVTCQTLVIDGGLGI